MSEETEEEEEEEEDAIEEVVEVVEVPPGVALSAGDARGRVGTGRGTVPAPDGSKRGAVAVVVLASTVGTTTGGCGAASVEH